MSKTMRLKEYTFSMDKPSDVNLRYTVPIVTSDGHVVMISDNGVPTVLFFQAREQHESHVHGDVVAAVRLSSMQDLKNLSKAIDETVKNYKNREP
jgi:outer membrane lipoprotein-sorting protein